MRSHVYRYENINEKLFMITEIMDDRENVPYFYNQMSDFLESVAYMAMNERITRR